MSQAAPCGRRAVLGPLAALTGGALFSRADAWAAAAARLRIGDAIPDLTIQTIGGGSLRLGTLRGQVLVVNFFASYCVPCRSELPILIELVARLGEKTRAPGPSPKLLPVGIDDRPADSASFAASLGVKTTVLVDPDGGVRAAFDPQRYPCTFLVDAAGTVRHINRGFGPGYAVRVERWLRELLALPA